MPTPAEVSIVDAVPTLNRVVGVTRLRDLRSAQPKPSAQAMSPSTPTATESPGRFCSARAARMTCREPSTASDHRGDGSDCVADGALCGCGCSGAAPALTYITSPTMTAISPLSARTPSAARVLSQFLFFDILYLVVDA